MLARHEKCRSSGLMIDGMSAALEYRDRIEERLYPVAYAMEVIAAGNYANGERGVQYWGQSQWQAFFFD